MENPFKGISYLQIYHFLLWNLLQVVRKLLMLMSLFVFKHFLH